MKTTVPVYRTKTKNQTIQKVYQNKVFLQIILPFVVGCILLAIPMIFLFVSDKVHQWSEISLILLVGLCVFLGLIPLVTIVFVMIGLHRVNRRVIHVTQVIHTGVEKQHLHSESILAKAIEPLLKMNVTLSKIRTIRKAIFYRYPVNEDKHH